MRRLLALLALITADCNEPRPSTDARLQACYQWCSNQTQLDLSGEQQCLTSCEAVPLKTRGVKDGGLAYQARSGASRWFTTPEEAEAN